MREQIEQRFAALKERLVQDTPKLDVSRLDVAFQYAYDHHDGQVRKDGTPFVTHPLAVAEIVAEQGLDADSVIAALLHDCIEDTPATHAEIAKIFGKPVADLVEGVTKLTRVQYTSKEEEQMENLRKMLMAMAKDIRVMLIKIADRLHNMRTMQYQKADKQHVKSLETMEIYAPIAHRLGMQKIKWELEDLCLQYLDPVGHKEISDELERRSAANAEFLDSIAEKIKTRLRDDGISATVYGRVKHIYSIYRKMYAQSKGFDEIYDLYAFRVILDDMPSCYNVLGCVHDLFRPVLGRFKDYIGTPKPNMYQSLHTTVIGREGIPFEVQIRTWEMHQIAEYGVAAHWKYKQGMADQKLDTEENFEWVRKLLESQQDVDAEEFVHTLKVDMFADEVFVFTPSGDVINLPAGATPIDFAYNIHSAVGNAMTGAKVNGRIVTFDYKLQNGEILEILTSKSARGPSRDWLKIAKSNEARNKIRQWFKKERRDENITHGRSAFESELKRQGLTMAQISSDDVLPHILKKISVSALDDMYAAIGYGGMTSLKAVNRVKEELRRLNKTAEQDKQLLKATAENQPPPMSGHALQHEVPKASQSSTGIIVEGLDNCLVKFSKCCTPVPGDDIIGFITKGYGVSIHRTDCPNADEDARTGRDAGRWVKVQWSADDTAYKTSLEIHAKDRDKLTLDIAMALSAANIKLESLSARAQPDGFAITHVVLLVRGKDELQSVMNKLNQIQGVLTVMRAKG